MESATNNDRHLAKIEKKSKLSSDDQSLKGVKYPPYINL